ncbi:MAG: FAD-dependent oxidoreductase [Pseudomonadota bacterium]
MATPAHHVIVGAGPAGVTAAETLRKLAPADRITIIGDEPEAPYSRMAIPYLLEGDIDEAGTHLRSDSAHFSALDIEVQQDRVVTVVTGQKRLQLASGHAVDYSKLLIATGSSPARPPINGLDAPGVHHCWTLADARHIISRATSGDEVVLLGAGFIGCIILEALASRGVKLTVVEMGDRMVPRMLDEAAGGMLKRWCEDRGIRVLTGTRVTAVEEADSGLMIATDGGEKLPARLFVVAAGVKPNVGFLASSGIEIGDGIRVDHTMQSSAPDVYAAGDVAEARDLSTGGFDVLAIQPVAVEHGYTAAMNMAGHVTEHRGSLNMNVLDTVGLISTSFGSWMGVDGGDHGTLRDDQGFRYLRLEFDGDRLVGGQSVGMTEHVGIMRGLIQTGLRLGSWKEKLQSAPERIAEAYIATAHGIADA